jgi:hypothetical protein
MTLRGSRLSKCQINGSWLPKIPKCESSLFVLIYIEFVFFSQFIEPIPCSIPALPRDARYIHRRPFMEKIPDGNHLEYICKNSPHRQRIICRRGKILPRNPLCYNGNKNHFNTFNNFISRLSCE